MRPWHLPVPACRGPGLGLVYTAPRHTGCHAQPGLRQLLLWRVYVDSVCFLPLLTLEIFFNFIEKKWYLWPREESLQDVEKSLNISKHCLLKNGLKNEWEKTNSKRCIIQWQASKIPAVNFVSPEYSSTPPAWVLTLTSVLEIVERD